MKCLVVFILTIFTSFQKSIIAKHWEADSEGKCLFTLNRELIIYFSEFPSLFVNSYKKKDLAECRAACCSHDTCNGYVWDVLDADNCKLLKCSKKGDDCKNALKSSKGVSIGEVGFITGLNDELPVISTTNHPAKTQKQSPKPFNEVDPLAWLNRRIQIPKDQVVNVTKPFSTTSTPKATTIPHKKVKTNQSTTHPARVTPESTAVPVLSKKNPDHEHTNNVSLTIALLFGLGFSVTVLYMLGRRWIEGVKDQHKRGYTRISYLLNGV